MIPLDKFNHRFLSIPCLIGAFVLQGCDDYSLEEQPLDTSPKQHSRNMVLIEAMGKSFQMGSDNSFWGERTRPAHTVQFTYDFWMDTTEVMQSDYDQLMAATYPAYSSTDWDATYGAGDLYPVFRKTWYDAVLYCNARSIRDGFDTVYTFSSISGTPGVISTLSGVGIDLGKNGYRLPTEAEWEYACRGGTAADFYWGDGIIGDFAWYSGNANGRSNPVAQKSANAYGLYDMSGNVWEWCNDWYASTYYDQSPEVNPTGPATGTHRIRRGGSWFDDKFSVSTVMRNLDFPGYSYFTGGFRVVRRAD